MRKLAVSLALEPNIPTSMYAKTVGVKKNSRRGPLHPGESLIIPGLKSGGHVKAWCLPDEKFVDWNDVVEAIDHVARSTSLLYSVDVATLLRLKELPKL
jgi:hypothetical protein